MAYLCNLEVFFLWTFKVLLWVIFFSFLQHYWIARHLWWDTHFEPGSEALYFMASHGLFNYNADVGYFLRIMSEIEANQIYSQWLGILCMVLQLWMDVSWVDLVANRIWGLLGILCMVLWLWIDVFEWILMVYVLRLKSWLIFFSFSLRLQIASLENLLQLLPFKIMIALPKSACWVWSLQKSIPVLLVSGKSGFYFVYIVNCMPFSACFHSPWFTNIQSAL